MSGSGINHNFLDNWYFGNPVNQRGLTEYTESGYCIDRWMRTTQSKAVVRLLEDGLEIDNTASTSSLYFRQYIYSIDHMPSYTFSALVKEVVGQPTLYVYTVDDTQTTTIKFTEGITYHTINNATKVISRLQMSIPGGAKVVLKAIKLEIGDTQTLAHQDADGNWVLNEIPNYADQMAICKQYDPITGEYIGLIMSDTNSTGDTTQISLNSSASINNFFSLTHRPNGGTAKAYSIFGEHNKPNGSYTGNGSATERTISVGGIHGDCGLVVIHSANGGVILTRAGGLTFYNTTTSAVKWDEAHVLGTDGKIVIKSTDAALNQNGTTYYYRVL